MITIEPNIGVTSSGVERQLTVWSVMLTERGIKREVAICWQDATREVQLLQSGLSLAIVAAIRKEVKEWVIASLPLSRQDAAAAAYVPVIKSPLIIPEDQEDEFTESA